MREFYKPESNSDVSGKSKQDIIEGGFDFAKIEDLPDSIEPSAFYRGVPVEDALLGIAGQLIVDANPKDDILGPRDNASLSLNEAVSFAPSSQTKDGKNFLCAIGFNPLPGSSIARSGLNQDTFIRFTGPVKATEVILRFAGKESGRPRKIKIFSPREFVEWYRENMN